MGAWGIKALERDEGLDVLDILKNEYVPEHPVMDLGEIDVYKRQILQRPDGFQINKDCRRLMEWKLNGTMRVQMCIRDRLCGDLPYGVWAEF